MGAWGALLALGTAAGLDYWLSRRSVAPVLPSPGIQGSEETARQLANFWGQRFSVPPALLMAVWRTESEFDPFALNMTGGDARRGGAWGLGQMTLKTAQGLTSDFPRQAAANWPGFAAFPTGQSLFNINENAAMSAFLLSLGMRQFGERPFDAGVSYKMGMRYVSELLDEGGKIPRDLTPGARQYWGRLKTAAREYAA